jgi:hypothetical protein
VNQLPEACPQFESTARAVEDPFPDLSRLLGLHAPDELEVADLDIN